MHKSRLAALVIDCEADDLRRVAAFWGPALGGEPEASGAERNPRYLRIGTKPDQVHVLLQRVDHRSRVHLDIETDDVEAEVRRLEGLGGKVVGRLERWVVMEAPSGHRFCVVHVQRVADFAENANVWP